MYNQRVKSRFIREFSDNPGRREVASALFEAMAPYEESWGADFCTKGTDEIVPVVTELIGAREASQVTRLTVLKEYVTWCDNNGIDGARLDLLAVESFGLDKLRRQMVANPRHLERYLNTIFEPVDEQTTSNTYRCYYWMAYAGIKEDDAFLVKSGDVDFENMVIRFDGMEYPLYREGLGAFRECVNATEFRYVHPNYKKPVMRSRASGDTLLRGISEARSLKAMRVEISRKQKKQSFLAPDEKDDASLALKLSFHRLGLSGLFYRTYEAERAGMPPNFMAAAARFMEGKQYSAGTVGSSIRSKQKRIASEYMTDYQRWKEAYKI